MQIQYQISEDDYVSAGKLAMRKRSKLAAYQLYFWSALGVLIIAAGVIAAIGKSSFSGMLPVLLWGSILLLLPLLWGYQFRRVYRKAPLLRDPRTLDIDDNALHFATANSEGRTTWEAYIKFAENESVFILFQQGNQIFVPIPKRELAPVQIPEPRSLFETHLPRK